MRVKETYNILLKLSYRPLDKVIGEEIDENNKGIIGILLRKKVGISKVERLDDGVLKTSRVDELGEPKETMAVKSLAGMIEDIFDQQPFSDTSLYNLIKRILYVPIVKDESKDNWYLLPPQIWDLSDHPEIVSALESDYTDIVNEIISREERGQQLNTITGQNGFLQIRTKDTKPYTKLISPRGTELSDKKMSFYLTREFLQVMMKKTLDNTLYTGEDEWLTSLDSL